LTVQIVVNTRLLLKDRLDGMGWFTYQTLKRITTRNPDVHFVFLFDRPFHKDFIFSDNITPMVLSPQARHPLLYYIWFQWQVKNLVNRMKPDLFLSPDGFLSLGAKCRQLPVIHDINFHHHPKDSKWLTSKYYNYFFPKFAREATRIATVSKYSKRDISQSYHIDPALIDVVYNGIHDFFRPLDENEKANTRKKFSYGKDYFLFVGSLHPRKNIGNLVSAFTLFKNETGSDMKLLIAGPGFWGLRHIHQSVERSPHKNDIVFTERLNNDDLARVTGSALALTFVPYYEGFGIPLVEAMSAHVPVITSNVTSMPEVAGDAALLVDPHDPEGIKNAMVRLYRDGELREDLVRKGTAQKERFSWDRSSDLLWQSILRAAKASPN
jgi:glycosyltransferase involved in cell wall biosynthesis